MKYLVAVLYRHNHGEDLIFRIAEAESRILAEELAVEKVRAGAVDQYGEDEVEEDEREYGGFEAMGSIEDGRLVEGLITDCAVHLGSPTISKAELAAKNSAKETTSCAACGGSLKQPMLGIKFCPICEG